MGLLWDVLQVAVGGPRRAELAQHVVERLRTLLRPDACRAVQQRRGRACGCSSGSSATAMAGRSRSARRTSRRLSGR